MQYQFSKKIDSLKPSAIREILKFTSDPGVISFAAGNPAPEAFPTEEIARITAEIMAAAPVDALQYSLTEGYTPLRNTVRDMLKQDYEIGTQDDDVIIVSGAQQGIELACKCLCDEGDVVLCENPSFIGSLNSFRSFNTTLVGIPTEADGISISALEQAIAENPNAKLLYLIPNFQNPSGITTSLQKRKQIYALAQQHGIVILEDNPYGDLRFTGTDIAAIKSLDTTGHVIYCGTFSKTIAPGFRTGFVCANKQVIAKLVVAKQGEDVHSNVFAQMICYKFLTEYDYKAHLAGLRDIYKKKAMLMQNEIKKHFPPAITINEPQGGLFIWGTLPPQCDMNAFCKKAVEAGVAVVPGNAFMAGETDKTTSFRMNYSTPTDENISKGVAILGRIAKEFLDRQ